MTKPLIVVGTHHKTGTVWLWDIFNEICKSTGRRLFLGKQGDLPDDADIFFEEHSKIDVSALKDRFPERSIRGVHIIRDPRDVIVSAVNYHMTAKEPWLHEKREEFGGRSYQQMINSLPDQTARLIFEMQHSSKWTIHGMVGWNYDDPLFYELRYEQLIRDEKLDIFRKIFTHLNIPRSELELSLDISFRKSLFSGNRLNPDHVKSGQSGQWRTAFTAPAVQYFQIHFADALKKLNYDQGV